MRQFLLSILFSTAIAEGAISPEQLEKRVHAHLIIADYPTACQEAMRGVCQYPNSKTVWLAYLRALAKAGDEKAMMANWKIFTEKFPEERNNREMLEHFAWAVINKGAYSPSPQLRVIALLGGFFSQDVKGVFLLQQGLKDENSFIRAAAAKLSSHFMDASLQSELHRLLQTEKVWKVRLEVIRAIGEMRFMAAKKELKKIIGSLHSHPEEKAAAIEAIVAMTEEVNHEQIAELVSNPSSGMRMLACELIAFFDQSQDIDKLYHLLEDHHPDARAKAFQAIGRLRSKTIGGKSVVEVAQKGISDPDPVVAITAAWVLTINDPDKGLPAFQRLINHNNRDIRSLAASALAATGKYGLKLTKKAFFESKDPYVKMNLAIGLIGQRSHTQQACDCLHQGLSDQKEKWSWNEDQNFKVLAPNKEAHDESIPNYPEAVNQLTRLEILQMMALVHYPQAQEAIKHFLKESNWGISGLASALLLTEGDEEAADLVQSLLKEEDPKIRMQAALILALWGKGEDAVQILQESYAAADREVKAQILEGIGRVGSENALHFLAERLQEPYQTLRIMAAAALLECLYH
jgi:HEAT repeat protein